MKKLTQLAMTKLTTDRADVLVGQLVCFATAIALFVVAVLGLSRAGLDKGQLIIGLLAAIACMLLMIVIGMLLPLQMRNRTDH